MPPDAAAKQPRRQLRPKARPLGQDKRSVGPKVLQELVAPGVQQIILSRRASPGNALHDHHVGIPPLTHNPLRKMPATHETRRLEQAQTGDIGLGNVRIELVQVEKTERITAQQVESLPADALDRKSVV